MKLISKIAVITGIVVAFAAAPSHSQLFLRHYENFMTYTQPENIDFKKAAQELSLFKSDLKTSLEKDFEGTYKILEEMKEKLVVHLSSDRKVLSVDWDNNLGGSMRFFDGIYCVQHIEHRYKVIEKNPPCSSKENGCLYPVTYDLKTIAIPNKDTFYLFFEKVIGSSAVSQHTAKVARLNTGQLDFTQALFQDGTTKRKELSYQMDWSAEDNQESEVELGSENLMFDENSHTIMVPRFEGEKILPGTHKYILSNNIFIKQ